MSPVFGLWACQLRSVACCGASMLKVNFRKSVLCTTPPSTFEHAMEEWQEFCQAKVVVWVWESLQADEYAMLACTKGSNSTGGEALLSSLVLRLALSSCTFSSTILSCLPISSCKYSFLISSLSEIIRRVYLLALGFRPVVTQLKVLLFVW